MTDITADEYRTAAKVAREYDMLGSAGKFERLATELEGTVKSADLATQLAKAMLEDFYGPDTWDEDDHSSFKEHARAALEFLAGRLIPAGGMALTAEQVEDVRTAREGLRGYRSFDGNARGRVNRLIAAVDALFPATEPAEEVKPVHPRPDVGDWGYGGGAAVYAPEARGKTREELLSEKVEQLQDQVKHLSRVAVNAAEHGIKAPSGSLKPCGYCHSTEATLLHACTNCGAMTSDPWSHPAPAEPAEGVKPVKFRKMTPKYATANFGFPDVTVDPFTPFMRWAYKDSDGDKWVWNGDQWELHVVPPAPAEPAEEETKALPAEVGSRIRASVTRWSSALEWPDSNPYIDTFVLSGSGFWDAENDQFTVVPSCFSYIEVLEVLPPPVAPAPAETGPWQRIEDVPESVYLIKDCEGDKWRRDRKSWEVYSERGFRWHPGFPDRFAPFVAAEEG